MEEETPKTYVLRCADGNTALHFRKREHAERVLRQLEWNRDKARPTPGMCLLDHTVEET